MDLDEKKKKSGVKGSQENEYEEGEGTRKTQKGKEQMEKRVGLRGREKRRTEKEEDFKRKREECVEGSRGGTRRFGQR